MAKVEEDRTLARLDEDTKKELDAIDKEIDIADEEIKDLETLGLDLSRLKERTAWARKAQTVIRKHLK